jgi:hypothetical protein
MDPTPHGPNAKCHWGLWSDAAPAAQTATQSVRHIGEQIEAAVIEAAVEDEKQ